MEPYGSQNFKTLLLPQITFAFFQPFLNFLVSCPHESTVWNFLNFEFLTFQLFFFFFRFKIWSSGGEYSVHTGYF